MKKTITVLSTNPELYEYIVRLADDRLILGHRLSEWCGHAPILEEDIALSNIALDCIGQANMLYTIAIESAGKKSTPDELVFFREAQEYKNLLLVEQPNTDFAHTIVRQFLYDAFGVIVFEKLQTSRYHQLAVVAQKCYKELQYHFRHSSQWMLRLGDGTEESHTRAQSALTSLWKYTDEIFLQDAIEENLEKEEIAIQSVHVKPEWEQSIRGIIGDAALAIPESGSFIHKGGRAGNHSEHLGHLLAEMQIVARSYPEIQW